MVRRRALVFMDTNSLLRLLYAIATARYKGKGTPLRVIIESGRLQVLVTNYILEEAKRRIEKLLTKRTLQDWGIGEQEILSRLLAELDNMVRAEQVVPVDADSTAYTRIKLALEERSSRRVLLKYRDWLLSCVKNEACRRSIEKDLPVVEGILLAYDIAVAVPVSSRAGITRPPFPVVTDDRDLFCSLYKCLHHKNLRKIIILMRYETFKQLVTMWTMKNVEIGDQDMYKLCLLRSCTG